MKKLICLHLVAAALSSWALAADADSLYREDRYQPLVSDRKAQRVGDSITVLVLETASASASADTSTDRNTGLGMSIKNPIYDKNVTVGVNDDFAGRGKVQRSGKLLAQITVTVESVEANGDLNVKGEQLLEVNDEKQAIKLEGRIRRADISETNTVPSNRLANARISYVGDGILGDTQKPGILTRILRWLGL
jgi:flagellar L-ring protein precursor FlgH